MSTQPLNQFDRVAPYYDALASAVYGKSIRVAQTSYLKLIPDGASILVIGGGTGWWLPQLLHTPDVQVCFVEASEKMLKTASERVHSSRIEFIHGTAEDVPRDRSFDVVITHFFLDLYGEPALRTLTQRICRQLKPHGRWLIADFVNEKWWHAVGLKVMYTFFYITCHVKTWSLPAWKKVLESENLKCVCESQFYGKFISSCSFELLPR